MISRVRSCRQESRRFPCSNNFLKFNVHSCVLFTSFFHPFFCFFFPGKKRERVTVWPCKRVEELCVTQQGMERRNERGDQWFFILNLAWSGARNGWWDSLISLRVGCLFISSTTFSHLPYLLPQQLLEEEVTERKGKITTKKTHLLSAETTFNVEP